jgi:hypothetical protein
MFRRPHRSLRVAAHAFGVCAFAAVLGVNCPTIAATLRVADWEQPRATQRTDTGDYSPYVDTRFTSSKTLSATTSWLKSALERYGDVPVGPNDPQSAYRLSDVRFAGCTMQWVERRSIDKGRTIQQDAYTLALRDVGREPGNLQVQSDGLRVSLSGSAEVRFVQRIEQRDGGVVTSSSATSRSDSSFTFPLQRRDDSARRIGTALVHASRLCSAGPH